MMPERWDQQAELLGGVAGALFRGDWRTARLSLSEGRDAGDRFELVDIAFCLDRVTECLRLQSVRGEVEAASDPIDTAAGRLKQYWQAHTAEAPRTSPIDRLLWTTGRLVQRERADLDALLWIVEDLPRGKPEVVYAGVEHLTTVEFDPYTVRVHPRDRELTGLDDDEYSRWRTLNRGDICARATRLRQFADVHSGSVSDRTWLRMGGHPSVREQALRALAAESLTRGRSDLPVRLGRRRAWEYAQRWIRDTVA